MTIKRIAFFSLFFFFFLILFNLLSFAKANQNTILIKKFYEIGQAKLKFLDIHYMTLSYYQMIIYFLLIMKLKSSLHIIAIFQNLK